MWTLQQLKRHREVIDQLDWDMTPEKAVETYLEWGTGWSRKGDFVRHAGQVSYYFVVYDWEKPLRVTLVRRDVGGMEEIATIDAPQDLIQAAIYEGGKKPGVGVYALTEELANWLKNALYS